MEPDSYEGFGFFIFQRNNVNTLLHHPKNRPFIQEIWLHVIYKSMYASIKKRL
jgi:hypothetical protein